MKEEDRWERIKRMQDDTRANFKIIITQQAQLAHINRAYYESLVEQGFSEEQAMRLVETQVAAMHTPPDSGGE